MSALVKQYQLPARTADCHCSPSMLTTAKGSGMRMMLLRASPEAELKQTRTSRMPLQGRAVRLKLRNHNQAAIIASRHQATDNMQQTGSTYREAVKRWLVISMLARLPEAPRHAGASWQTTAVDNRQSKMGRRR